MTDTQPEQLKIVIVGHVDHGKSTFIGRLFYDTGSLPEGKYEQLVKIAEKRGVPFEFANLMDSLQSERDQNITMDTSQIWFRTPKRQYVIIDAPGHKEFLKNMITGAARADAAFLLIAANEGVQEQSRRHGYLLSLLGIRQVVVLVNKMDMIGYSQETFEKIRAEYSDFLAKIGVTPKTFIPMAAKHGATVAQREPQLSWYTGQTVLEALDEFEMPVAPVEKPLRFPLQDIYRFDHRRILTGKIESGRLQVGDRLVFAPGMKSSTVKSIERWNEPATDSAHAGQSIGITLTEQIFVERGHVAMHDKDPAHVTQEFEAKLFWMGKAPMELGRTYRLKINTQDVEAELLSIDRVIDASTLSAEAATRTRIEKNDVAEVRLRTKSPVAFDTHDLINETGRFVIVDKTTVSGGGIIIRALGEQARESALSGSNLTWNKTEIGYEDRILRHRHKGAVVWLTGLSGAGKSTIANELEKELFLRGMQVAALDGDNLRFGLCKNLGFSREDRSENIRRAAEVARLMADHGLIVVVSLISPFRIDRAAAREIAREGALDFFEVYVNAPLSLCEERDPKHLYKKARAGEISDFTGISSPYEVPESPEIELRTDTMSPKECVTEVLDHILRRLEVSTGDVEI
ncbi:MAG: adenylyl-sulfate kinase [Verrucomicrobiae bacterium]|nr:adenylyl-sulfate kinase [Verrucomicrobiae bacterium]